MEFDENNRPEEEQPVEIYSRRAIFWFSILPFPAFGGILLALNLKNAGFKRAILPVIFFSILFTVATRLLISRLLTAYNVVVPANYKMDDNVLNEKVVFIGMISIICNIIGATILTRYFFKQYFPDNDYYPRNITIPLIAAVLLYLLGGLAGI